MCATKDMADRNFIANQETLGKGWLESSMKEMTKLFPPLGRAPDRGSFFASLL
jgi:hypothetical protein